jgi:transcriptional regulator with XRE-family HTH domain
MSRSTIEALLSDYCDIIATMMLLPTPAKAQVKLAENLRERRLDMGFTQAGLAVRSGVALATLRKFERTGAASIGTLLKLLAVVGGLEEVIEATAPVPREFSSIDEVIGADARPRRRIGWRS